MIRAWSILAVVLMTASALAAPSSIIGPGLSSCGTWTKERGGIRGEKVEADEMWILGFLAGIGNLGQTMQLELDPLKGMDAQGVFHFVDNYCQAHPTDLIGRAAVEFAKQHPH